MTAFLFPDCFIGPDAAQFVSGLAGTLNIVSPADVDTPSMAKDLEARGLIRQVTPAWLPGELEAFLAFLTNARIWGASHAGAEGLGTGAGNKAGVEANVFAIRDAVNAAGRRDEATKRFPLLPFRAFAHLARRLAAEDYEAAEGLARVQAREKAMFRALSGLQAPEQPLFVVHASPWPDPEGLMRAWAPLFLALDEPARLFVTCDPAGLDALMEKQDRAKALFTGVRVPVFARDGEAFAKDAETFRKALSTGEGLDAAAEALSRHPAADRSPLAEICATSFPAAGGAELFGPYAGSGERATGPAAAEASALALSFRFLA